MPLLLVVLFLFSPLAEAKKIVFASDPYPPYIHEENGVPQGMALKELTRILGVSADKIEVRIVPWKRALKMAETGEADIIGPMQVDPQKTYLVYTHRVFMAEEALWTLRSNHSLKRTKWKDLQEFKTYNMGIVLGYEYGDPFGTYRSSPTAKKVEVKDVAEGLQRLLKGEIALFICNTEVLKFYAQKENIPMDQLARVGRPVIENWGVFGVSRKSPLADQVPELNRKIISP